MAGTAIAVAALTGCDVPALEPGAGDELQQQVLEVTEAAAAGDYEQALADLDALSLRLDTAAQLGEVSRSREEKISSAIEAVRMSLETEIALRGNPITPEAPSAG